MNAESQVITSRRMRQIWFCSALIIAGAGLAYADDRYTEGAQCQCNYPPCENVRTCQLIPEVGGRHNVRDCSLLCVHCVPKDAPPSVKSPTGSGEWPTCTH